MTRTAGLGRLACNGALGLGDNLARMLPRGRPDPQTRRLALVFAGGRLALGAAAAFATAPSLRALGFGETDGAGRTLARMAGARDLALGALVLASLEHRRTLRATSLACAAADAADALAFADALARREGIDRAALGGGASALAGTGLGLWIAGRT